MATTAERVEYVCRMCRTKLFTSDDLMEHEPQKHQISTRKKLKEGKIGIVDCNSFFLAETKEWMDEAHLAEGKLFCPVAKCNSRFGSFDWSGSQCSCGTWVTPSIQITKSRVDPKIKMHIPSVFVPVIAPTVAATEEVNQAVESTET
ncbi:hypothetical protein LEN26_010132 [Aphanomyces euteiches]|nr:hypothetical protein LEN26_010132 [Aphanomyces euteiches]KAH9129799.1 hypothetical protein AeMF1_000147 [Aphanomyces euteiches]KAH9196426.1 hypothetical protein AeNC1_001612 [Aphanomyces euteiches]